MSSKTKVGKRILKPKFEKIFIPGSSSRLARTHRIIRIEREKEIQFMKLCRQIHLDDSKKIRSEKQREDRKLKRVKKNCIQTYD